MGDEVCVFQAIGWMDDAGEMVEDVVVADVTTFPTDVQDALAIPNLQECVGQFMDTLMSKPETQTCLPTYSEEDSQLIQVLPLELATLNALSPSLKQLVLIML